MASFGVFGWTSLLWPCYGAYARADEKKEEDIPSIEVPANKKLESKKGHPENFGDDDTPIITSEANSNVSRSRSKLHGVLLQNYVDNVTVPHKDMDQKTSVLFKAKGKYDQDELVYEKFRDEIQSLVIDNDQSYGYFEDIPYSVFQRLCFYLDYDTLMNSRLVCKSWNASIQSTKNFLSRNIFCLQSCNLTLIEVCRNTEVKWKNVRCSFVPCLDADCTKGYYKQYFVNKLLLNTSSFLVKSVTTIILHAFEVHQLHFMKWVISCENLKSLELIKCSLKMSKTNWTRDTLERATMNIKSISMINMSLVSIVDFGNLIMTPTRRLALLKIIQMGVGIPKGPKDTKDKTRLRIKTLEEGFATMLRDTVIRNKKYLKHIHYTFQVFQNPTIHLKIVAIIGGYGLDLQTFSFNLLNGTEIVLQTSRDFSTFLKQCVRGILMSSSEIRSVRVPLLSLNFSDIDDLVWDFPITLKSVETQLQVPFSMRSLSPNHLRERTVIKRLTLRGSILETDTEWSDLYKCIPWLSKLTVHCLGVTDDIMQSIIKNFSGLTELRLTSVKGLTDCGPTGVYICGNRQKSDGGQRKSFQSMLELKLLVVEGDYRLTDITMQLGFLNPKLEYLTITGSPLDITPNGLLHLAENCPELQTLVLQVKQGRDNISPEGFVEQYSSILKSKLPRLKKKEMRVCVN